jgi:hypothetical protein
MLKDGVISNCNIDSILDAMQEACEESIDSVSEEAVLLGYNYETFEELYSSGLEHLHITNPDSYDECWEVDKKSILKVKNNITRN